jgi:hypothetical protein
VKGELVVYRVDTENLAFQPVTGIGNYAVFVSEDQSIVVDTSIFLTVQTGSIYYCDNYYDRTSFPIRAYNYGTQA